MQRLPQLVLLLLVAIAAHAADPVDRIVATVNRQPILASDLKEEARFEALEDGKAPDSLDHDLRGVLKRMIERELVCQQMSEQFEPTPKTIASRIADIRAQFPEAATDAQWHDLLDRYDLDEADLSDAVKLQLQVVHFLDVRLRPTVRVDSEEITDYYDNQLVPKLKAAGAKTIDPIDSVKPRIEELLMQQKMSAVFDAWVANLRSQSTIRILDDSLATPAVAASEKGAAAAQ